MGNRGTDCHLSGPTALMVAPTEILAKRFLFQIADTKANTILTVKSDYSVFPNYNRILNLPTDLFMTSAGDIYIANSGSHQILKMAPNGLFSVVAGNGAQGYSGDNGLAINAQLNNPVSVTVTSSGTIYIADFGNSAIRKVSSQGVITTVTTTASRGSRGVIVTQDQDILYSDEFTIRRIPPESCLNSDNQICSNHGQCINKKCVCQSGWNGDEKCSTFSCDIEKPSNALSCIGPNQFSCLNGWFGNSCQYPMCFGISYSDPKVCSSHGKCTTSNVCSCDSGWRGDVTCSKFSCDIAKPPNADTCIAPNQFSCKEGWYGNNCNSFMCFGIQADNSQVCSSHGSCTNVNSCECQSGWRGDSNCGKYSCEIAKKENYDKCVGPNRYSCSEGWFGDDCEYPVCFGIRFNQSTVCSSHGKCISNNTCRCESGWNGDEKCSKFSCDIAKPLHSVYCIAPNKYSCEKGWFGDDCNLPMCFDIPYNSSKVCNSHGKCNYSNLCECESGWRGDKSCSLFSCEIPKPPNGDKCIGPNIYSCREGSFGDGCSLPLCFGIQFNSSQVCSSHGKCISADRCECDSGWRGDEKCGTFSCEITKPPNSDKCIGPNVFDCETGWFGENCELPTCFGIQFNNSKVCSSHGICVKKDYCECEIGWNGNPQCSNFSCEISPIHSVKCVGPNIYECENGWFGETCELPLCFGIQFNNSNVCNAHGLCISGNVCECETGWRGDEKCGKFSCEHEKPQNADQCIGPNQYSCISGWFGKSCNLPICFGIPFNDSQVCSSHGNCFSYDSCDCQSGWHGDEKCSKFSCDLRQPIHSVNCIGPNTYDCENGWFGEDCKFPSCFGISFNDTNVCSSHGNCTSGNKCDCVDGWKGDNKCSTFSCNIPLVHRVCNGPNEYSCESGWYGEFCDIAVCFGKLENDSSVCNSNGDCISNNTCYCDIGWEGPMCTTFNCEGVGNCNSHGRCISNNTCECNPEYSKLDCSEPLCYGQLGNKGCNQGVCTEYNKCTCYPLYFGDKCNNLDCNPDAISLKSPNKICNSNGICKIETKEGDNTTICKCNSGFSGQFCQNDDRTNGTIIGIVLGILISLVILVLCVGFGIVLYLKKFRTKKFSDIEKSILLKASTNSEKSDFKELLNSNNISSKEYFKIREKEFKMERRLGSGAFGSVFEFKELSTGELFAVKQVEVNDAFGSEFKEVVNMFELSEDLNQYIVPILGCTMVENARYICIVMPLYECDMRNWVHNNQKSITVEIIIEIIRQITLGLQYLHSKNLIHRDLKQANIYVSKSPNDFSNYDDLLLCIGDWGSSRSSHRVHLTTYEGSIAYSAPESIIDGDFSPSSDIWSLGCILYQLLSGDYVSVLFRVKQKGDDKVDEEVLLPSILQFGGKMNFKGRKFKFCYQLLCEMIRYNPKRRISTNQILERIENLNNESFVTV